jgi:hypothetical protein
LSPTNKQQQFSNEATRHDLPNTVDDVDEMQTFKKEVEQTYAVIRSIDTTGFESASIFMPTPSRRESQ